MELHSPSFGSFKAITEDETYSIIMNWPRNPVLSIPCLHPCWSSALMSSYRSWLKWLIFHLKVAIFPQHAKRLWFDRFLRRMVLTPFLRIIDRKQSFLDLKSNQESGVSSNWQPHEETWFLPINTICLQKEPYDILMEMNSQHAVLLVL